MENDPESYEEVPRLNIDGLVYALEIAGDSQKLYEFLFDTVPDCYPDRIVDLYTRLVSHTNPDIRKTAAIGIEAVMIIDENAGLELAERLLQDQDLDVVSQVKATVWDAAGEDELPTTTLDRFAEISSKYQ